MAKTLPAQVAQEQQADAHVDDMLDANGADNLSDIATDVEAENGEADTLDISEMTPEAREAAEAEASNRFMMRRRATAADVELLKANEMSIAAQIKALRASQEAAREATKLARKEAGVTRGAGVTAICKRLLLNDPQLSGDVLVSYVNSELRRADPDNKPTKRSTTDTIRTDLIHSMRQLENAHLLNDEGIETLKEMILANVSR